MTLKHLIGLLVSLPIWLAGWWGIWWIGHLCYLAWPPGPSGDATDNWYFLPMVVSALLWIALGGVTGRVLFREEFE